MTQIARDVWEGKQAPEKLNQKHIQETYSELVQAARKGYGKEWLKVNGSKGAPDIAALKMQQNLYRFSQVKDYAMLVELNTRLTQGGKVKNWEAFKTDALKLNKLYNLNYLQAEWQTARQAGHHAANWSEYQRNADRYPNLKYATQGDARVRNEHQALKNIIRPVEDPFWDIYYPPNGWRCRCFVVQTTEAANQKEIPKDSVKPEFYGNVGKTGQTFSQSPPKGGKQHPYFALAKKEGLEEWFNRQHYKYLKTYSRKKLVGKKVQHSEMKAPIEFNNRGIKEAFNQPHKEYNDKNLMIPYMDSILKKATYLGWLEDLKKNVFIEKIHVFKVGFGYAIIREQKDGRMVFYSITDSDKITKGLKK